MRGDVEQATSKPMEDQPSRPLHRRAGVSVAPILITPVNAQFARSSSTIDAFRLRHLRKESLSTGVV